ALGVLLDPNLRAEAARYLHQHRRWARVEAIPILNDHLACAAVGVGRGFLTGKEAHYSSGFCCIMLSRRWLNSRAVLCPILLSFWSIAATSTRRARSRPVRTGTVTWGTRMPKIS